MCFGIFKRQEILFFLYTKMQLTQAITIASLVYVTATLPSSELKKVDKKFQIKREGIIDGKDFVQCAGEYYDVIKVGNRSVLYFAAIDQLRDDAFCNTPESWLKPDGQLFFKGDPVGISEKVLDDFEGLTQQKEASSRFEIVDDHTLKVTTRDDNMCVRQAVQVLVIDSCDNASQLNIHAQE